MRLKWLREHRLRLGLREVVRVWREHPGMGKLTHKRVRDYEEGRQPPADYLAAVVQRSGVNPEWLLLGVGPAMRQDARALSEGEREELRLELERILEHAKAALTTVEGGEPKETAPLLFPQPARPRMPVTEEMWAEVYAELPRVTEGQKPREPAPAETPEKKENHG